ncbi:hypothetical protein GBAR_LOCUS26252 [Geodia barretti]|uniref:Uncharacterized protein n=1 Tax=Geodia barretti TaxID=519541 RepID=A0AA35TGE6_GEOBA|nr:hypothetical protein GBAR_LOCUS26252 [Geodia barretti]
MRLEEVGRSALKTEEERQSRGLCGDEFLVQEGERVTGMTSVTAPRQPSMTARNHHRTSLHSSCQVTERLSLVAGGREDSSHEILGMIMLRITAGIQQNQIVLMDTKDQRGLQFQDDNQLHEMIV